MFSGGTYDEVARWLLNFLLSHAKREHPRVEVVFEAGDARDRVSYTARLILDGRSTSVIGFDYADVAAHRRCRGLNVIPVTSQPKAFAR